MAKSVKMLTDKKESILNAALELFATEGYSSVSTSRIAKAAGVSEGLIFRHFGNKKGLLDAIVEDAEKRLNEAFAQVMFESNPREVIRKTLMLPYQIGKEKHNFWKLQFKLKWEAGYNKPEKMKPVTDKLTWAFSELKYDNPAHEAQLLNQIIEAISIGILRDGHSDQESYLSFLLGKYDG